MSHSVGGVTAASRHPDEQVWESRAEALLAGVQPVLGWARGAGHALSGSDIDTIVSLPGIAAIVDRQRLLTQQDGQPAEIVLPDAPDLTGLLRQYLLKTGGYEPARPCAEQSAVVSEQHFLVLFTARHQLHDLIHDRHAR